MLWRYDAGVLLTQIVLSRYFQSWKFQIPSRFKSLHQGIRSQSSPQLSAFFTAHLPSFSPLFESDEEINFLVSRFVEEAQGASELVQDLRPLLGREAIRLVVAVWRLFALRQLVVSSFVPESEAEILWRRLCEPITASVEANVVPADATVSAPAAEEGLSGRFILFNSITQTAERVRTERQIAQLVSDGQRGSEHGTIKPKSDLEILAEQRDYKRRRASYRAKRTHITKRTPTQVTRELIRIMMMDFSAHPAVSSTSRPPAASSQSGVERMEPRDNSEGFSREREGGHRYSGSTDSSKYDDYDSRRPSRSYSGQDQRSSNSERERSRDDQRDRRRDSDRDRERHGSEHRSSSHSHHRDSDKDRDRDRDHRDRYDREDREGRHRSRRRD